jgi:acetylornithine deacetylase/succinyl-diaminopimelate desuccinylase-like protein
MADRMVEELRRLGCQEAERVDDKGIWAYYDAGAPKTIVVHLYYSTSPFVEERWSFDPLAATRTSFNGFDDVLVGRGALAAKGPNRFFLNACESIRSVNGNLPVNVMFVGNGDNLRGVLDKYRARLAKADCLLNPTISQGRDGEVTTYLGYKGMVTLEFVCTGSSWGRGPQQRPMYTSRVTVLDSPIWRLIDALRSMYDPDNNRILIEGYYDAIREPNDEERRLMHEIVNNMKHRLFAYERDNIKAFRADWTPEEAAHHLMFDTTFNVAGVTAPAAFPHRASARVDSRLVPDQEPTRQIELVRDHLARGGFGDIEVDVLGHVGWSQNSIERAPVQAVLSVYEQRGYEPLVWPRYPGSHNEYLFTRELGLAAARGGLGHGGNDHADDEYIVIGRQGRVAGIVDAEASIVDILMTYAALEDA